MADIELRFQGDSIEELIADLRLSAVRIRDEADKTVWEVGAMIAAAARQRAGEHSSKIAPTVKLRTAPGMAIIRAGSEDVPLAALYELGNKGRGARKQKTFKHPVFGNRGVWVAQARYPFLRPAVRDLRPEIAKRMDRAWERALEPVARGGGR